MPCAFVYCLFCFGLLRRPGMAGRTVSRSRPAPAARRAAARRRDRPPGAKMPPAQPASSTASAAAAPGQHSAAAYRAAADAKDRRRVRQRFQCQDRARLLRLCTGSPARSSAGLPCFLSACHAAAVSPCSAGDAPIRAASWRVSSGSRPAGRTTESPCAESACTVSCASAQIGRCRAIRPRYSPPSMPKQSAALPLSAAHRPAAPGIPARRSCSAVPVR